MSFSLRVPLWGFSALAGVFLFSSCASRKAQTAASTAAEIASEGKAPASSSRRSVSQTALIPPSMTKSQSTPQPPSPSLPKTERIIRLVRQGVLIKEGRDTLVFTRLQPLKDPSSGLYEDAITLGKLRRKLKVIDGLPASVPATATVQNATAFLKLDGDLSAETTASAIDTALKTDEVASVCAQITGAVRL